MLKWIVWSRIVLKIQLYLPETALFEMELFLIIKLYLRETELFEIELINCIKMFFAANNQQRLICHKTQPTNKSEYVIL